jgi:tRNA(Ile)-lysidine synthase
MEVAPLVAAIEKQFLPEPPARLGVAVSGGGDSVALLALLAEFAKKHGSELHVITINHGLRDGAQDEIRLVTDLCAEIGCAHHVEYWSGWDGGGNLQDRARVARYEMIADWALGNNIDVVALGHTANDQAETVMMRLARGAGVDGLSAMTRRTVRSGITLVRPMLGIERRSLRAYLRAKGLTWAEDPSNDNRDFERIRMRDALRILEPLGISVEKLTNVADYMSQARTALNWQTFLTARTVVEIVHGTVCLDKKGFRALPHEISRRLLVHALNWVSHSEYPPRRSAVAEVFEAIKSSQTATLHGCQLAHQSDKLWVFREYNAVKDHHTDIGDLWDERWYIDGPEDDPVFTVSAIGPDGILQVEDWRESSLPRAAVLSMPGIFLGSSLVAAPFQSEDEDWTAELDGGADGFFASLLSH